ncbi:MAG: GFA family protein [Kordiimonadaceae bacterium]|nr:GFA family protein [Kordiimonadaceae bacterium]
MIKGNCLCASISYEYDGELTELAVCHCGQCRRAQGSAFATNAPVKSAQFTITAGEELLKSYYSCPGKRRVFCSNCGSPIFSQRDDTPEVMRLRVGTITSGNIRAPDYQIYCADKADWLVLSDNKPKYVGNVPE